MARGVDAGWRVEPVETGLDWLDPLVRDYDGM
jgi:hypothetical protein